MKKQMKSKWKKKNKEKQTNLAKLIRCDLISLLISWSREQCKSFLQILFDHFDIHPIIAFLIVIVTIIIEHLPWGSQYPV